MNSVVYKKKNRNKRTAVWIASTLTPITAVNSHREYSEAEHKGCDDLLELHNGCLPFTFQPLKCGMNPDQCPGRTTTLCGFDSLLQKLLQKPFLLLCQNGELMQWMPNNILIATDRNGSVEVHLTGWRANYSCKTVSFIVSWFYVSHKLSCISGQNFT